MFVLVTGNFPNNFSLSHTLTALLRQKHFDAILLKKDRICFFSLHNFGLAGFTKYVIYRIVLYIVDGLSEGGLKNVWRQLVILVSAGSDCFMSFRCFVAKWEENKVKFCKYLLFILIVWFYFQVLILWCWCSISC